MFKTENFLMFIIIDMVLIQTLIISYLNCAHSFLTSFPFLSSVIATGLPRDCSEKETHVW